MTVSNALIGVSRLGLYTSPVVYYVEQHPTYFSVCEKFFQAIAAGSLHGIAGSLTLTETLVMPLRNGNGNLAGAYRNLLTASAGITTLPITASIAESAADLRARYNLRTADAVQIAAALSEGCEAFLTGDKGIRRVTELRVLVLDDLTI